MMREPRESEIQSAVMKHWALFGLPHTLVAAIPNAKAHGQPGLTPGLPDLLVIGGRVRIGFVELKSSRGRLRPAQGLFMNLCAFAGIAHAVTYNRDEPIAILESWGVVRPQVNAPAAYRPGDTTGARP